MCEPHIFFFCVVAGLRHPCLTRPLYYISISRPRTTNCGDELMSENDENT